MRVVRARALILLMATLSLLAVPAAQAHGTLEAQELEVHVLNDEGSDTIEPYGGYDINDALFGSAYLPDRGDSVYLRLELYGTMSQQTGVMPWTVVVSYNIGGQPFQHQLSTTDGTTFTHDFADLQSEVDPAEHSLHIQRAFLTNGDPRPGVVISDLTVTSFWGDDVRDIAPGGIPVPGTGGAAEYPDPTQIDGSGRLTDAPMAAPVDAYFGAIGATRNGTAIDIAVTNGLRNGGQHVIAKVLNGTGWTATLAQDQKVLDGNATGKFTLDAVPAIGAAPLVLEFTSDVGGRILVDVREDGSVHARGAEVLAATPPAPAKDSPGLLVPGVLLALLVGLLRRKA